MCDPARNSQDKVLKSGEGSAFALVFGKKLRIAAIQSLGRSVNPGISDDKSDQKNIGGAHEVNT
ncbi:MAG: hypothetical protein AAGJ96_01235 [Pseudomonadota bacterium]